MIGPFLSLLLVISITQDLRLTFEDYTAPELSHIFRSFLEAYPLDPSERAKDDGALAGKPNPHRLVLNPGRVLAVRFTCLCMQLLNSNAVSITSMWGLETSGVVESLVV